MRLKTYQTPAWARRLVQEVCQEEGIAQPSIKWMKRKRRQSSGNANRWRIHIVAGTDRKEVKIVLLHELTHSVMHVKKRTTAHPPEFYAKLFEIGRRHRCGAQAIKARDGWYKPRSIKAGYRLYLKQLREAQSEA